MDTRTHSLGLSEAVSRKYDEEQYAALARAHKKMSSRVEDQSLETKRLAQELAKALKPMLRKGAVKAKATTATAAMPTAFVKPAAPAVVAAKAYAQKPRITRGRSAS